jgi:hypothetical protein
MIRTTIMADRELIDELREIAKDEQVSLGEVIRQGLAWRATTRRRIPSFVTRRSKPVEPTDDGAVRDEELLIEWVKARDARRDDAGL